MRPPPTLIVALGLAGAVVHAPASPFAAEVVRAQGPFGPPPYDDPNAVLGAPATWFYDPLGAFSGGSTNRRVKLVEAAHNVAPTNSGLLTPNLLLTLGAGSEVIVRFDQPVYDHPANPYGIDLLVFGNAFYPASGFAHDGVNMNTLQITGGGFAEPTQVSVSPGFTGQPGEVADDPATWPWYRYEDGPYADAAFPTHAYHWNRAGTNWSEELMDFTKPVNPAMKPVLSAGGLSAADGIDLYDGSGGGTGFDLRESGFTWIRYVKVEGIEPGFSDGEIDAFARVRPAVVGDTLSIAPANLSSNTAILFFQRPGAEDETVVTLRFSEVSGLARVSTAALEDLSAFAPVPGTTRTAVQLNLAPLLGATPVEFIADLALTAGSDYAGHGGDLLLMQSVGTNWAFRPFAYDATNHQVRVTGITNFSAFVVAQFVPPPLRLVRTGADAQVQFSPLPGLVHTLERTTNLVHWTLLDAFTATNASPVSLTDSAPPAGWAFYRLRLNQP